MRLGDLSACTGVSVASLKYYQREGVLPAGLVSPERTASYDDTHLARVRLIRALLDSGGLSVAAVRSVVDALDRTDISWHALLGTAQRALSGAPPATERSAGAADGPNVSQLLQEWGWSVGPDSPYRAALTGALRALDAADIRLGPGDLSHYAAAMHAIAEIDLSTVPRDSPEAALRQVVLGTVLLDPVLLAMRRLAQEDVSAAVNSESVDG